MVRGIIELGGVAPVAALLGTQPSTVKKHLEHVFEKLGVETRTAAAGMAVNKVRQLAPG